MISPYSAKVASLVILRSSTGPRSQTKPTIHMWSCLAVALDFNRYKQFLTRCIGQWILVNDKFCLLRVPCPLLSSEPLTCISIYHKMTSSTSESSSTKAKAKPAKKEKIFHPQSRKAGQLARTQLRQSKLAGQASKRSKKHSSKGRSSYSSSVLSSIA